MFHCFIGIFSHLCFHHWVCFSKGDFTGLKLSLSAVCPHICPHSSPTGIQHPRQRCPALSGTLQSTPWPPRTGKAGAIITSPSLSVCFRPEETGPARAAHWTLFKCHHGSPGATSHPSLCRTVNTPASSRFQSRPRRFEVSRLRSHPELRPLHVNGQHCGGGRRGWVTWKECSWPFFHFTCWEKELNLKKQCCWKV